MAFVDFGAILGSVVADMAVCVQDPKGGRFAETPRVVSPKAYRRHANTRTPAGRTPSAGRTPGRGRTRFVDKPECVEDVEARPRAASEEGRKLAAHAPDSYAGVDLPTVLNFFWSNAIRAFIENRIFKGLIQDALTEVVQERIGIPVEFQTCRLGAQPLQVHGVKATTDLGDMLEVVVDFEVVSGEDSDITLGAAGAAGVFGVTVCEFKLRGPLSLHFVGVSAAAPFVQGVTMSFAQRPAIDVGFSGVFGLVQPATIAEIIRDKFADALVLPSRIAVPVGDVDYYVLKYPAPEGRLTVRLQGVTLSRDKADCEVSLRVGAEEWSSGEPSAHTGQSGDSIFAWACSPTEFVVDAARAQDLVVEAISGGEVVGEASLLVQLLASTSRTRWPLGPHASVRLETTWSSFTPEPDAKEAGLLLVTVETLAGLPDSAMGKLLVIRVRHGEDEHVTWATKVLVTDPTLAKRVAKLKALAPKMSLGEQADILGVTKEELRNASPQAEFGQHFRLAQPAGAEFLELEVLEEGSEEVHASLHVPAAGAGEAREVPLDWYRDWGAGSSLAVRVRRLRADEPSVREVWLPERLQRVRCASLGDLANEMGPLLAAMEASPSAGAGAVRQASWPKWPIAAALTVLVAVVSVAVRV